MLAVHISDNILTGPWLVGGFVGMVLLCLLGAWRVRDDDIPQIALLTSVFFVASLIHVSVGGVTSVHLLLNGLMGIVLRRHVGLGVPVGLFLQYALIQHGGITTLGINSCIIALPALLAWQMFAGLQRVPWVRRPWFRAGLVIASTLLWLLSVSYCVALLATNAGTQLSRLDTDLANRITFHPLTLVAAGMLALVAAWGERRLENAPEFALGLLIGEVAVLVTVLLNSIVLVYGGQEDWPALVLLTLVPHLFIAVIEGVVLGFTVSFLVRVKPEMIGWSMPENQECAARVPR